MDLDGDEVDKDFLNEELYALRVKFSYLPRSDFKQ